MRTVISRAMTRCEDGAKKVNRVGCCQDSFLAWRAPRGGCTSSCLRRTPCQHRYVGKLERPMYGTRDAPMIWQDHLRKTLLDMKFKESVLHAGVFQHETRGVLLRVHVDDMLCTGVRDDLMWLKSQLLKEYELETKLVGDG